MALLAPGRSIVLIGLMGAGKSTVGRLVAARLGRPFRDTDAVVEHVAGATVAELFATEGERGFRDREAAAVRDVAALRGQVVAVGGGAVLRSANVTQLRSTGDLILLEADPSALAARLAAADEGDARPLLHDADVAATLRRLWAERDAAYRAAAGHLIDTTERTPEEVAQDVLEWARDVPGLLSLEERAS